MSFLRLAVKMPHKVCVALSGGADSVVAMDFCLKGGRDVIALHFNHGNEDSSKYQEFVENLCKSRGVTLVVERLQESVPKGRSAEDYWREKRYEFFKRSRGDRPVIMGHHLDDAVETWVFTSLKGNSKVMPYKRDFVLRPFILNEKCRILQWAKENSLDFVTDQTNFDISFDRNYIRREMMPHIKRINPGIQKMIKKKILKNIIDNCPCCGCDPCDCHGQGE